MSVQTHVQIQTWDIQLSIMRHDGKYIYLMCKHLAITQNAKADLAQFSTEMDEDECI